MEDRFVWIIQHTIRFPIIFFLPYADIPPEEVVLFRDPQERRFFNRMQAILEPSYFKILQDYAKALSQKMLFSNNSRGKTSLDQMLAEHASIMWKKEIIRESLNLHLAELFQAISGRTECLRLNFNPRCDPRRNRGRDLSDPIRICC